MHSLSECEEAHQQVACAWLTNHTNVWEDFIPEQAHCSKGEFVRKEGACSAGARTTTPPTLGRVFCLGCFLVAVFDSGVAGIELFNVSCQVFCEKCPAGQYVDKSSYLQSCYACPAGKYADQEGTSECTDCPVGKAHNITSADDSSTCADCRVGQYQDSPGSTACTSCDAGQYQGAVGKTYCDSCTVGWYQSQSGQSKCAACPEHSGSCKLEIQVRQDPPSTKTRPCL